MRCGTTIYKPVCAFAAALFALSTAASFASAKTDPPLQTGQQTGQRAQEVSDRADEFGEPRASFVVFGHVYPDYDALRQSVDAVNRRNPDFVVFLGDTLPSPDVGWDEALGIIETISAPVYVVPGNHDIYDRPDAVRLFTERVGPLYQTFSAGDTQFVLLNTAQDGPYGKNDISGEQRVWLQEVVANATGTRIMFMMHHCLFYKDDFTLCNARDTDSEDYWWNTDFIPLVKERIGEKNSAVFTGDTGKNSQPYFSYREQGIAYYGVGFSSDGLSYPPHFLFVELFEDDVAVTPVVIRNDLAAIDSLEYRGNAAASSGDMTAYTKLKTMVKKNDKQVLGFFAGAAFISWAILCGIWLKRRAR